MISISYPITRAFGLITLLCTPILIYHGAVFRSSRSLTHESIPRIEQVHTEKSLAERSYLDVKSDSRVGTGDKLLKGLLPPMIYSMPFMGIACLMMYFRVFQRVVFSLFERNPLQNLRRRNFHQDAVKEAFLSKTYKRALKKRAVELKAVKNHLSWYTRWYAYHKKHSSCKYDLFECLVDADMSSGTTQMPAVLEEVEEKLGQKDIRRRDKKLNDQCEKLKVISDYLKLLRKELGDCFVKNTNSTVVGSGESINFAESALDYVDSGAISTVFNNLENFIQEMNNWSIPETEMYDSDSDEATLNHIEDLPFDS